MIGRERIVFFRLAQVLLPGKTISPDIGERAHRFLRKSQGIVRAFYRFAILLFEWGTFLFRTAGSIEHFCLLSPRAKSRYVRFWMNHKRRVMRQIFQLLRLLVLSCFYDDRRVARRLTRRC